MSVPSPERHTRDALLDGRLVLWQPARGQGYRFNLDPVLLANFASPAKHVLDLGAGVGVVGLIMLVRGKAERVTAVELQPELAELARKNAEANGLGDRLEVVCGDCRSVALPRVDAVVCNPPYFPARTPPPPGMARGLELARHELNGALADLVAAGLGVLQGHGHFAAILLIGRRRELGELFTRGGAASLRRRSVLPRAGQAAKLVMLEGCVGRPAVIVDEPALVLHQGDGREFTSEVAAMLR